MAEFVLFLQERMCKMRRKREKNKSSFSAVRVCVVIVVVETLVGMRVKPVLSFASYLHQTSRVVLPDQITKRHI